MGSFLPGSKLERYAGGNLAVEIRRQGGQVITTSERRSKFVRLLDMLATVYSRRRDYEIAHITVFSDLAFIYAECVFSFLSLLGKPCTLGLHGGSLPDFAKRHPRRIRNLLRRSHAAVCPSRYLYEELKEYHSRLHLIPNALHLERYSYSSLKRRGTRLLWLRAFHAVYNPQMAVAMLSRVTTSVPSVSMTMVGPDKGDGSLQATRKLVSQLGLSDRVSFLGAVSKEEVPGIMARHDIFVNSTNVDNAPVSVIEAMSSGLPVVSTNVGGLSYLLEDGKHGLLVPAGDPRQMADAVERLLIDGDLAQGFSIEGRRLAETFDWKIVLPQWQRLFASVITPSSTRPGTSWT